MKELGKLKLVDVREQWKHEEHEFTPWLTENLGILGKTIGIDLELVGREVAVGPYSADILATNIADGTKVVIENQLGKTDHDHLGKCLTYASVLGAKTVIWLTTEFTDEHQRAVEWLNDISNDEISFYAVKLELWQIDNSAPAVNFDIIVKPNILAKRIANGGTSDDDKIRIDFWTKFEEALTPKLKVPINYHNRHFNASLGKSGINISNSIQISLNSIKAGVYISEATNLIPVIEAQTAEIEQFIGEKLVWNKGRKDASLRTEGHSVDFDDENNNWKEAIDWLVEKTVKLHQIFTKILKEQK